MPTLQSPSTELTGLILIVDDTPANLEVICTTLADAGLECAIADSGERALQQLERFLPDLILLDVMMPGIDGFETCRRIKSSDRTCHIPIIFMTALTDVDSKVRALDLGAIDYVSKPFHEKEILARVKTHLQLHYLTQDLATQVAHKTTELQNSQLKLIQNEKMSALGNLVSGVAHEINNPVGCIIGNVVALQASINDLFHLLDLYQQELPQPSANLAAELDTIDLAYLREDLPHLIRAMQEGGDRIKSISHSLRVFSRSDSDEKQKFDLHEGIDSTLLILRHRLKANEKRSEIAVIKNYDAIPEIECFPGQLNQVFMNILANAIDMFDEMAQSQSLAELKTNPQQITIRTALLEDQVQICIRDNGKGMAADVQTKIFDHLFTTKGVGKGTGLGLAIARQIVVDKHNGSLEVQAELGHGTEFCIRLPIGVE
ncbi:MAG: hybrid sensor histidine kinase/response regulator [Oculatellaceae cyanobacterium Prado106]|jgi:signal transduction histidine kinase|nr:hybrid sensor histidine kinase/response regulator [Oculatellaceae cyanobacterium Prado106]